MKSASLKLTSIGRFISGVASIGGAKRFGGASSGPVPWWCNSASHMVPLSEPPFTMVYIHSRPHEQTHDIFLDYLQGATLALNLLPDEPKPFFTSDNKALTCDAEIIRETFLDAMVVTCASHLTSANISPNTKTFLTNLITRRRAAETDETDGPDVGHEQRKKARTSGGDREAYTD